MIQGLHWERGWQQSFERDDALPFDWPVVRGAGHAARAFAEQCLPPHTSAEVFDDIATPLALFFLCGDVCASQTEGLRVELAQLFSAPANDSESTDTDCWITALLERWWQGLNARVDLAPHAPRVARLLREDFAAVLDTILAGPDTRWEPERWEHVRIRAIGLRAFIELTRVRLAIPLPAHSTEAWWARTLDLCARCARLLNDAGSLPRDLASLQAQSEVSDPNWILIRAQAQRPEEDPRQWSLDSLGGELEACRRLHNVALTELDARLRELERGALRELILQAIAGHEQATYELCARYVDAGQRLHGFDRVVH